MARVCDICNKGLLSGKRISFSHRKSNHAWAPNLKKIKALVNGTPKKINVCTRCIRSGKVKRAL